MSKCKTCGSCEHFLDGKDFDLCCELEHPGTIFGFLCYSTTPACKNYEELKAQIVPYDYFNETMNIK